jgi:hypothetical protein
MSQTNIEMPKKGKTADEQAGSDCRKTDEALYLNRV